MTDPTPEEIDQMVSRWNEKYPKDAKPTFTESGQTSLTKYLECYVFGLQCQVDITRKAVKLADPACYAPIVEAARELGWAIGIHGSRARDVDFMAMPWTDAAADPDELAMAIGKAANAGVRCGDDGKPLWGDKPHGRKSLHILTRDGTIIDLAVMPRRES